MATWPAYALLLFDGYEEQPQDNVDRTPMEDGLIKQAPRQSVGMVQRPARFRLKSKADYLSLKTFVISTLHQGADWFDWTDPVDGVVKQARIVGGYGGMRFTPLRKNMELWEISFALETYA